jgi:hypothetical protein
MIRGLIERLERRVLFSGSIPSGTHLAWSGPTTEGVAHETISPAITLTLEDSHGNVVDASGVEAILKLSGNGSDRILGKAVLENGVAARCRRWAGGIASRRRFEGGRFLTASSWRVDPV